jgi:hypothetical protein
MSTQKTLAERMLFALKATTPEARRYKVLEEATGIDADRWKAFSLGRQRPTAEMIEAFCVLNPELAFWIATGRDGALYDQKTGVETDIVRTFGVSKLVELVEKAREGWTFIEKMRAKFICMQAAESKSDPVVKALKIALAADHLKISIEDAARIADEKLKTDKAGRDEVRALEMAKNLLGIE